MKYFRILPLLVSAIIAQPVMAYSVIPPKKPKLQLKKEKPNVVETEKSDSIEKNKETDEAKENLSAKEYYIKGRENYLRFTSKGYKDAITLFDKALKLDKKYYLALAAKAEAQALLSRVIYQPKNGVIRAKLELQAYESAYIASEVEPNLPEAHRALSMVYFVQGRYDEGKDEANKAIKLKDNDSESYLLLWLNSPVKEILKRDNYKSSNYYKALDLNADSINKSLELNPDLSLTYLELGVAAANQENKYNDAIDYYNKVLELNPSSEEAYTYLGFLYNNSLAYNDAITHFNSALKIEPNRSDAIYGLGVAYLRKRDRDTALEYFEDACDVDYKDSCSIVRNLGGGNIGLQRRSRRNGGFRDQN